jgi:uncharacterized protein (DUF1810 family)
MIDHPFAHFIEEQQSCYQKVLSELSEGRKQTHWMWFIFPQLAGLGSSSMARRFAMHSVEEAQQFFSDRLLGRRLLECTELVMRTRDRRISEIFDYPDDLKFHSSMTLFAIAVPEECIFREALAKYFDGKQDVKTLALLVPA